MKTRIALKAILETVVWQVMFLFCSFLICYALAYNLYHTWAPEENLQRTIMAITVLAAFFAGVVSAAYSYQTIKGCPSKIKSISTSWLSGVESMGVFGKMIIYGIHISFFSLGPYLFYSKSSTDSEPYYYLWTIVTLTPLWIASVLWILARMGRNLMLLLSLVRDGKLRRWEQAKKA